MARFFYICVQISEDDLIDALAERYGWTVREILGMDFKRLTILYSKAIDAREEKTSREEYNAILPLMAMRMVKFIPFSEYKNKATGKDLDLRPQEEILAEVEEIRKELSGEKDGSV